MPSPDVIKDHYGPRTAASYDQVTTTFWAYAATLEAIGFELAYGRGLSRTNRPLKILDLGAGTGNLIAAISSLFGKGQLNWLAVDQSSDMLKIAVDKLDRLGIEVYPCTGYLQDVALPTETFDAVVSSFAVHHLNPEEKKDLFRRALHQTKPGGVFVFGDRFTEADESCLIVATAYFRQHSAMPWAPLDTAVQYMKEQFDLDGDKPSTEHQQRRWMREAGWQNVRCPFRSFICGVISGVKI